MSGSIVHVQGNQSLWGDSPKSKVNQGVFPFTIPHPVLILLIACYSSHCRSETCVSVLMVLCVHA